MMSVNPILACLALALTGSHLAAKPLKVFILAGQSNMQGHALVRTMDYIGDDPATAPLLADMRGADGKPTTCKNVWISYLTDHGVVKQGKLTAGFGAQGGDAKIGPEFTFGLTMEKSVEGPVLIIKTAWGGKSLHTDFRSPSAGPYVLSDFQIKHYPAQEGHGIPKDFEKWKADKVRETGLFYRQMIAHVKTVLGDPKTVVPTYDPADGYELAGFVWLQGWNDACDHHTYPNGQQPGGFDLYATLLAHFIRDVRKDLAAPRMPFVIGVMGVGGVSEAPNPFRQAMAAPAALPEFQDNVTAVQTAPFWDVKLGEIDANRAKVNQMEWMIRTKNPHGPNKDGSMTDDQQAAFLKDYRTRMVPPADEELWNRGASNFGFHYLGCAKTFAQMGRAFAEANLKLLPNP